MKIKSENDALFGSARYYDYIGFDSGHLVTYGRQTWPSYSEQIFDVKEEPIKIIKCGFDKTRFETADDWRSIMEITGLTDKGELPREAGFLWESKSGLTVVTGDHPITGRCRNAALNENPRNILPGWAGYIGVEGPASAVMVFVGLVFMKAYNVKNFNPIKRSYI